MIASAGRGLTCTIELVDEGQSRHVVTPHLTVHRDGLALHAADAAQHQYRAVQHPQRPLHLRSIQVRWSPKCWNVRQLSPAAFFALQLCPAPHSGCTGRHSVWNIQHRSALGHELVNSDVETSYAEPSPTKWLHAPVTQPSCHPSAEACLSAHIESLSSECTSICLLLACGQVLNDWSRSNKHDGRRR